MHIFQRVFAKRHRVIVDPTTKLKRSFKACSLGASRIKAVLVCQSHRTNVACFMPDVNCIKPPMVDLKVSSLRSPAEYSGKPLYPKPEALGFTGFLYKNSAAMWHQTQRNINTGTGQERNILLVVLPMISVRICEWPYAPMTNRSICCALT